MMASLTCSENDSPQIGVKVPTYYVSSQELPKLFVAYVAGTVSSCVHEEPLRKRSGCPARTPSGIPGSFVEGAKMNSDGF
jgi:hypothetical protein